MTAPSDLHDTVHRQNADIREIADVLAITDARLTRLSHRVDQLIAVQAEHTLKFHDLDSKMSTLNSKVSTLDSKVGTLDSKMDLVIELLRKK